MDRVCHLWHAEQRLSDDLYHCVDAVILIAIALYPFLISPRNQSSIHCQIRNEPGNPAVRGHPSRESSLQPRSYIRNCRHSGMVPVGRSNEMQNVPLRRSHRVSRRRSGPFPPVRAPKLQVHSASNASWASVRVVELMLRGFARRPGADSHYASRQDAVGTIDHASKRHKAVDADSVQHQVAGSSFNRGRSETLSRPHRPSPDEAARRRQAFTT